VLRDYQERAIERLYAWLRDNKEGNPCLVLPTGAGKGHIVAALCKDALTNWPDTRVLMLTHVRELIEQNAEKMRQHWAGVPMGIYSASVGRKDLSNPITFAGIQSLRGKAEMIGHVDLVLIDECHLVSHRQEGTYRELIEALQGINPALVVIGLTATPWRMGHGVITDGEESLFHDLIEPVTIEELIARGFLAPLKSKVTDENINTAGVKKRGGEYIESQLQEAVKDDNQNARIADEIIDRAGDRKSWLLFCAGVDHSETMARMMTERGIPSACVHGGTTKGERQRIIEQFKAGTLRALTNANVLTTGFDHPDLDLIAMLRPTMSPALYVQMAGRGLRVKSHTDHCLVLDFAGNVGTHGPITAVQPPSKAGTGGEAPVKVCPDCHEIVHLSVMVCPECEHRFPASDKSGPDLTLRDDDIMGLKPRKLEVDSWQWRKHTSRKTGKVMALVTYYPRDLVQPAVSEYLPILHGGAAGARAVNDVVRMARSSGATLPDSPDINALCDRMNCSKPPSTLSFYTEGKFYRVISRRWDYGEMADAAASF